ncbi:uncharacterized protein (DUF2249 family) [Pelomonas saccharophila]|uniref:Uncharacterized protein (DUF2249 family) n=1 Tax=Roseateles saccharophilus TaxID=304 RepID=A0ABU1YUM8_ROSSA|nr:DUF2249 domain-containing protein [Roseateles saccharophilus]MDR7272574.1 uncharacterized protein (DUF2249 family) [Roseateles saccharophilus]
MNLDLHCAPIDLRNFHPHEWQERISGAMRSLAPRDSVELINDQDPLRLRDGLQAELPGGFAWEALQSGPDTWRVRITRQAAGQGGGCCGGCCGG